VAQLVRELSGKPEVDEAGSRKPFLTPAVLAGIAAALALAAVAIGILATLHGDADRSSR
jgi:hypothetical protein